jgi:hypothetical protein
VGTAAQSVLIHNDSLPQRCKAWFNVLDFLCSPELDNVVLDYTLRPCDYVDDENFGYNYEYDGPPLALEEAIECIGSNKVKLKPYSPQTDPPTIFTSQADTEPISASSAGLGHFAPSPDHGSVREERLRKILSGSADPIRTTADPTSLFSDLQSSVCRAYHSGKDVSTPDGLLKWQHWVLNKTSRVLPQAKNAKPRRRRLQATPQRPYRYKYDCLLGN